jgi:hypothetical protein
MAQIKIALVNPSTCLTDTEIKKVIPALQIQITRDFAPAWGIDADLIFFKKSTKIPADYWQLIILDNSDQAGALGYHDLTKSGMPIGKVFAKTDIDNDASWTNTMSHELLEMLGDPDINLAVFEQNTNTSGRLYAYETCDACEDDSLGYKINGVLVSDFVFPSYFESFRKAGTQFDFCKHIKKSFEILKGGYLSVYDVKNGNGWQSISAAKAPATYQMRGHVGSRRERRRTERSNWIKSIL